MTIPWGIPRFMKSGTLTNLAATSLRDQAKAAIMAAIVAGELQADALYSVQFFIDRLGVSATPIREALLDLASEHIVEVVRNRGYRVPTLTDKQLDDLLEVRLMLEVPGTVAAVDHLTDADIRFCAETADRCAEHAKTGNLVGFVELDRAFHLRILNAVGNPVLVEQVLRLRDRTRVVALLELVDNDRLDVDAQQHKDILSAIQREDRDEIRRLMTSHLSLLRNVWESR